MQPGIIREEIEAKETQHESYACPLWITTLAVLLSSEGPRGYLSHVFHVITDCADDLSDAQCRTRCQHGKLFEEDGNTPV